MLNMFTLVGRIKNIDKDFNTIEMIIPRSYKNENGEYENDFINIIVGKNIINNVMEYCEVGDLIGVKGKIEKEENAYLVKLIAEKVTFLSTKESK